MPDADARDRVAIQPFTIPHVVMSSKDEHGDVLVYDPDGVQEELPFAVGSIDGHVTGDHAAGRRPIGSVGRRAMGRRGN